MFAWFRKLRLAWQIAIVTIIATFLTSLFFYSLPSIQSIIYGTKPEVYIFLLEYDYSQIQDLTNVKGLDMTFVPIKATKDLISPEILLRIPLSNSYLEEVSNKTIFVFYAQNRGNDISKNIILDIDFTPFAFSFEPLNPERINILQGGNEGSTRLKFSIGNLYPNESQGININSTTNKVKEFSGWSQEEGQILNLYHYKRKRVKGET